MWRWEVSRSDWGWLWRETRRIRSSGPPAPAVAPVRMGEPPWSTDHRGKLPGRRQKENCPVPRPSLYNRWGNIGHHGISKHQSGNGRKYQCNKNQQVLRNVTICLDISRSCLVSHQNWRHHFWLCSVKRNRGDDIEDYSDEPIYLLSNNYYTIDPSYWGSVVYITFISLIYYYQNFYLKYNAVFHS